MSIANNIHEMMERSSWVRKMFEKWAELKAQYGDDNVFDLSLGNPVIDPPDEVHKVLINLLKENQKWMHRYMPNAWLIETREFIAEELHESTWLSFKREDITMCVGAWGGLNAVFKSILDQGDEVIALAPYFVEYGFYVQNHWWKLNVVQTKSDFQPDLKQIEENINWSTKAIIINSPNNPTGVVYSQEIMNKIGELLRIKEKEFGHSIYLISDEPYRNILFDNVKPWNIVFSHNNSIIVTSHSKDLALAGERIGYIAISPKMEFRQDMQNALVLATRILGFVNAPALMQFALPRLKDIKIDSSVYENLRDILYERLTWLGYDVVKPQWAFYMFPKSPIDDDIEFIKEAQNEKLLLVPWSGFWSPGFFRIAFCFDEDIVRRSLDAFERLAVQFNLKSGKM